MSSFRLSVCFVQCLFNVGNLVPFHAYTFAGDISIHLSLSLDTLDVTTVNLFESRLVPFEILLTFDVSIFVAIFL